MVSTWIDLQVGFFYRINPIPYNHDFKQLCIKNAFENTLDKEKNACFTSIFTLPQSFPEKIAITLIRLSTNALILDQANILSLGTDLNNGLVTLQVHV